eukprot:1562421-Pleurochrysis_carterae.AAC.7
MFHSPNGDEAFRESRLLGNGVADTGRVLSQIVTSWRSQKASSSWQLQHFPDPPAFCFMNRVLLETVPSAQDPRSEASGLWQEEAVPEQCHLRQARPC